MPRKLLYVVASAGVFLLPLIIVSILLWLNFNATILQHVPFYNDELFHWHQSVSFAKVGFNNGFYTFNENEPLLGFSRYYAWGAWVYAIYGVVGNLLGFQLHAIATINIVLFLIAGVIYIAVARPSWESLLFTAVILSTFIPLLIYMPSSLLQVMQLAFSLIIASCFYVLLTRSVTWQFVIIFAIFLVLIGLIRPTYALYLPPMFALAASKRTVQSTIVSGFLALPLVILAAVGFYTSAAPFPHFRTLLFLGDDPLSTKLANFGLYLRQSLYWLLNDGSSIIMGQRIQIGVLMGLLVIWGIYLVVKPSSDEQSEINADVKTTNSWWRKDLGQGQTWELAFHVYNLFGFYTATFMFHETLGGHDYRVMAPHFLISLLLLALMHRRMLLIPILVLNLFWLPDAYNEYQYKQPNFQDIVPRQFADWKSTMGDDLVYDPDAPSAWCNTVMLSSFYVLDAAGTPGMLLAIDAGMGVSWTFDWVFPDFDLPVPDDYKIPDTFKSRYLILTDADYQRFGQSRNLERIERAPDGNLYLNNDVSCE